LPGFLWRFADVYLFSWHHETVANTTHRLNQVGPDLAPESGHIHLHDIRAGIQADVPDKLKRLLAGKDLSSVHIDARPNSVPAATKTRRRPRGSEERPPSRRKPPNMRA